MCGSTTLAILQQAQRALVTRSRTHHPIQPRHRFGVVVQHLRLGLDHNPDRFLLPLEIGHQHFHLAPRRLAADLPDHHGERARAAQYIVIPVHAGDHGVLQIEDRHRFRHPPRFVEVDWLRPALGHRAKTAAAGAGISQHHEGRCALVPALPDVRAMRRLAHRMQVERTGQALQLVVIFTHRCAGLEPAWLGGGTAWRLVDLDEVNHA